MTVHSQVIRYASRNRLLHDDDNNETYTSTVRTNRRRETSLLRFEHGRSRLYTVARLSAPLTWCWSDCSTRTRNKDAMMWAEPLSHSLVAFSSIRSFLFNFIGIHWIVLLKVKTSFDSSSDYFYRLAIQSCRFENKILSNKLSSEWSIRNTVTPDIESYYYLNSCSKRMEARSGTFWNYFFVS